MNAPPNDTSYDSSDSWWHPHFLNPMADKAFNLEYNRSALLSARFGFSVLILFWCGFGALDLFLNPAVKSQVLVFRFVVVAPVLILTAVLAFYRVAKYQLLLALIEIITMAALIVVMVLYGDMGDFARRLGFRLSMLNGDAQFIFMSIWLILVYVASLSVKIRTIAVLPVSAALVLAIVAAIPAFRPSGFLVAIAAPFIVACIPVVYAGSLMMERLAIANYRSAKLLEMRSRELADTLEVLKTMFGRYLSTEVMASLIKNPAALELGGEKRTVTIMMTDLRGFTAVSERLEPEQVVQMLNAYFEVMVEVVLKYQGTINEIIGDALIVLFGAPQAMPDRTQRAIACAIDMQNAMVEVNAGNRRQGLPELEMGIGLNETEVIVGNIGSSKRSKYTVVGSGVNMTSRIESYSVGGQILVSESVRQEAGNLLRIDRRREIFPKGSEVPLTIYEVGGIAGQYNLALQEQDSELLQLTRRISFKYTVLAGKSVSKNTFDGHMTHLSGKSAQVFLDNPVAVFKNLKMNLLGVDENLALKHFYGKVVSSPEGHGDTHSIRFTAIPPEIDAYFQSHRQHAAPAEAERAVG